MFHLSKLGLRMGSVSLASSLKHVSHVSHFGRAGRLRNLRRNCGIGGPYHRNVDQRYQEEPVYRSLTETAILTRLFAPPPIRERQSAAPGHLTVSPRACRSTRPVAMVDAGIAALRTVRSSVLGRTNCGQSSRFPSTMQNSKPRSSCPKASATRAHRSRRACRGRQRQCADRLVDA